MKGEKEFTHILTEGATNLVNFQASNKALSLDLAFPLTVAMESSAFFISKGANSV